MLTYQDFSLSFLIYLLITFLVNLYSTTGKNALAKPEIVDSENAPQNGYAKLNGHARSGSMGGEADADGPEAYELGGIDGDHDLREGEDDAVKIGGEDEWRRTNGMRGVRL